MVVKRIGLVGWVSEELWDRAHRSVIIDSAPHMSLGGNAVFCTVLNGMDRLKSKHWYVFEWIPIFKAYDGHL